jgi:DHA2 family multidrug resistance protein-like MFS transporter
MLKNKWMVLAVISAGIFLVGLDMTVLFTALPTIAHELHASNSEKLWIINTYPLVMAGLLLGLGTLGDRIGHRPVFLMGMAIFGAASMLTGYAPSVAVLICGRVLMAVGAAMMMPASLALLRHTFTTDRERGMAIGIWGSMYAGATSVGPLIGGALLHAFPWGAVFLINVPIILVSLVLTPLAVGKSAGNPDQPWHVWNSVVVMVGLVGVTYGINESAKLDADYVHALVAAVTGIAFLTWFYRRQVRSDHPMVDFSLFKNPSFVGGILTIIASMVAFIGVQLVMTQQLQLVEGYSPFKAGAYIIPISLASFLAGPMAGSLLHKIGLARVLWLSLLTAALGLVGLALFDGDSFAPRLISMVVFGFGAGSGMVASSVAIMLNTPGRKAGMAASMEAVAYEFGGVLGVAVMGSLATLSYSFNLALPEGVMGIHLAKDGLDQALMLAESLNSAAARELIQNAKDAFSHAYITVLVTCALMLAVIGIGFAFNLKAAHDN